jgi:hypothetical protein
VEGVTIHSLIHLVEVTDDGLYDFFTDEIQDPNNLPDTIYTNDDRVIPVERVTINATVTGDYNSGINVEITPPDQGWIYLWMDDPAPTTAVLTSVQRSDGSLLNIGNILSVEFDIYNI